MGDEKLKIARTESLFRDVNERIAETAQRFEAAETGFVCECADPACTDRVSLPVDTYESVRSEPTRFVTVPGHELGEPLEEVVVRRRGFQVIEKVERALREHVRRLDPRAAA
jgi:hypothetical protein